MTLTSASDGDGASEEGQALLSSSNPAEDEVGPASFTPHGDSIHVASPEGSPPPPLNISRTRVDSASNPASPAARPAPQRQSSMSTRTGSGTTRPPRTSNRVRFDLESTPTIELAVWEDGSDRVARGGRPDTPLSPISPKTWRAARGPRGLFGSGSSKRRGFPWGFGFRRSSSESEPATSTANGHATPHPGWLEEEDPLNPNTDEDYDRSEGRRDSAQRERLLEGVEAGPVTAAMGETEVQDVATLMRPGVRDGMGAAFMNMANSIIGAGIIGQPYMLRQAGLLAGVALLIGLTLLVDWTIRLIVINSKLSGADSFGATMERCFGKKGLIAISIAQWAFAFGGMLAFCVVVGDTIPHVLVAIFPALPTQRVLWLFSDRRFIIVLFVLGISYPLALYRDIAKLAKASSLALISMLIIVFTIITQGAQIDPELRGRISDSLFIKPGVFQAIGVISFAFVCHHNSLLIYGSLQKPTLDRFARVTHYSTGVSCLACLAMALAGFLTFGDKTVGNVLNNFPPDNAMVNVARFCFGLNMLTTLPLEAFVCREVMLNYFHPYVEASSGGKTPLGLHVMYTTGLVVGVVLLSLLTCDLGAVFEIIGATSAASLAFVFPPICWLWLTGRGRKAKGEGLAGMARRASWKRWGAWVTVVFGCCVAVVSVGMAVVEMATGTGESAQCT